MAISTEDAKDFSWIGNKQKCYWPNYQSKKKFVYYLECTYKGVDYITGAGVIFNWRDCRLIGKLRCLYEDIAIENPMERHRAIVEMYLSPEDFMKKYDTDQKFYLKDEIIQREKPKYMDIPIKIIESRFSIVFACEYEDPKNIIEEFSKRTKYSIIMCRFKYIRYKGNATLKSVLKKDPIVITDTESDSTDTVFGCNVSRLRRTRSVKSSNVAYVITDPSIEGNPLKIKLKHQNTELRSKEEVDMKSPMTKSEKVSKECTPVSMLDNLKLTPNKDSPSYNLRLRFNRELVFDSDIPRRSSSRLQNRMNDLSTIKPDFIYYPLGSKPSSSRKKVLTSSTKNHLENEENVTPKKRQMIDNRKIKKSPIKSKDKSPDEQSTGEESLDLSPTKETVGAPKIYGSSPQKTPRIKVSNLTPSVQKRETKVIIQEKPFEIAKSQLHSSVRSGSLPCREQEYDDILNFIKQKLHDEAGGCMYISGVPGTGKTATVFQVMNTLQELVNKMKVPGFVFVKVNALALTEPRQIYVQIVKQIQGKLLHWEAALNFITDFFTKKKKNASYILLVDELDKLCTRKQDVVYNLLDLPSRCKTPLVVITIANTMDLPERMLANKINSRLGLTRLTFKPYKHKELIEIIKTRLLSVENAFKIEAIEFIARKVAAVSGDARRALAVCARSLEVAESQNESQVTMSTVDDALAEMSSSSKVQAIKQCSRMEQLILSAIANEVGRTGNEEVSFCSMMSTLNNLAILGSVTVPSYTLALRLCHRLGSSRLLITQHGRTDIELTLLLNVSPDDIHFAL